jgi:hypothetical protein
LPLWGGRPCAPTLCEETRTFAWPSRSPSTRINFRNARSIIDAQPAQRLGHFGSVLRYFAIARF